MPLQAALSAGGEFEILQADISYYWSVFNGILDTLELKSPLVEGSNPGDIYIGLDGLGLMYGSDEALAAANQQCYPARV